MPSSTLLHSLLCCWASLSSCTPNLPLPQAGKGLRLHAVAGQLISWEISYGLVASIESSLWWSVWPILPVPDPGWGHKSPQLARQSVPHSRLPDSHPPVQSSLLPRQASAQNSGPGPPTRRGMPLCHIRCRRGWLGVLASPLLAWGSPSAAPSGRKYYITTGCAVRDLRQAPGLKFPDTEFASRPPHPKNSIKKNNRKNAVRRGPARVLYLAAAVPRRSGGNWFCIAPGNWQKNKSARSGSRDAAGRVVKVWGGRASGGSRTGGAALTDVCAGNQRLSWSETRGWG